MATTLLIAIEDGTGWLAREGAGASWRAGQVRPGDARLVAIVPAEAVALHRIALPARRAAELRQAVPYALEDRLAEPVESLQFALGTRSGDQVDVAVVARRVLQASLDQLAGQSLIADGLYADAHLLPRTADALHIARIGERLLVAHGDSAHALALADWPAWRSLLPALPVRALSADGRWLDGDAAPNLDRASFLRYAATRLTAAPDLLQGEFAPRRHTAGRQRIWRWAALLAGLGVLLALTEVGTGVIVEQQRRARLRADMAQVFQQALPAVTMNELDPAGQMAAELANSRRGGQAGGPFAVLIATAPLLTEGSRYRLTALDWRLDTLELEIATSDVASLDSLRERMVAKGIAVEVTGVSPEDSGVRGRLRLKGART